MPGLVKGLNDVQSITASARGSAVVLASGRIMIWSEVRPFTTTGNAKSNLSQYPMLLSVEGLEQP